MLLAYDYGLNELEQTQSHSLEQLVKRLSPVKRVVFVTLAVVLGLTMIEGLLSFLWTFNEYSAYKSNLPLAIQTPASVHARHDPELGWVHIPSQRFPDLYGPGRSITINDEGFRGFENYAAADTGNRKRIVCVGDSFTLGYGVDDKDCFPAQLQQLNADFQVVNMGQSGYSVGQCYLWYLRDIEKLEANCIVYGLIIDDIFRMKSGRVINGYAVPDFKLVDGNIQITGQPVPPKVDTGQRMGDVQFWTFMSNSNSICRTFASLTSPADDTGLADQAAAFARIDLAIEMVREMGKHAKQKNVPFVLLLLPELEELSADARRETYLGVAGDMKAMAQHEGFTVVDLYQQFAGQGAGIDQLYLPERWHHYSEAGNALVAKELNQVLPALLEAQK